MTNYTQPSIDVCTDEEYVVEYRLEIRNKLLQNSGKEN